MTILIRQGRERLVLDLYYNQDKTFREISKAARISPCNIGVILNKAVGKKEIEGSIEEEIKYQDNNNGEDNKKKKKQHLSLLLKPTNSFLIERHHYK
jgi:DNA-binding transcriptional regulator LsrR (DeoR family)